MASLVFRRPAKSGETGSSRLEVDGAVFDLHDDIRRELAVERMKDVVGGAGAIGLEVVVVEVIVVDESAVENDAAVRRERVGEYVGGIGGAAAVAGWAGLAFGIGLDREAGEVGDERVDLIHFSGPPGLDCGIEGVEGFEAADLLRAGDVDAHGQTHAPGAHGVGDASKALDHVGVRNGAAPLTLFTLQPLMPIEASRRAYSLTWLRSSRTWPFSKKIDGPP